METQSLIFLQGPIVRLFQRTDVTIYRNVFGGAAHVSQGNSQTTCSQMHKLGGSGNMKPLKNSITGIDSEAMFGLKYYLNFNL